MMSLSEPVFAEGGHRMLIVGWQETALADRPQFDPATLILKTHRPEGNRDEAFEEAVYRLENGQFRLIRYAVDWTYDGKQDPVVVYDSP